MVIAPVVDVVASVGTDLLASSAVDAVGSAALDAAGAVGDAVGSVAGGIGDAASYVGGGISDAASYVGGGISDAASSVASGASSLLGGGSGGGSGGGIGGLGALAGSALGAGAQIYGANQAADAQTQAAQNASNTQMAIFNQTQQNLQPYMQTGQQANQLLQAALPGLAQPITMNQATLEQTPGYQFNLTQGLKAVQNGAAARGLGTSGAALKGAATYATGLADSTYQNQFNNAVTNSTNTYNRLMGATQLGQASAAGVGSIGQSTGASIGQNTIGAGNAQGAASVATGNAVASGANNLLNYNLLNNAIQVGQANASASNGNLYASNSWAPWGQPGYQNP